MNKLIIRRVKRLAVIKRCSNSILFSEKYSILWRKRREVEILQQRILYSCFYFIIIFF